MKQATVYLSNRLEKLAEQLRDNLFSSPSPFSERLLIVPSRPLEKWLRISIAQSMGIAAGFRSLFLNSAIDELRNRFFVHSDKPLPSLFPLFLAIEQELRKISDENDTRWQSVLEFLKGGEKNRLSLCKQLALLFQKYAIYGSERISQWTSSSDQWQELLWSRVMGRWAISAEEFSSLQFKEIDFSGLSIHLFGFSHLSQSHFYFFLKMAEKVSLSFYHLSPCQEFWSDFKSDRETVHFFTRRKMNEKLRLQWEELLEDRHPLLANWGKIGRENAVLIEESSVQTRELYVTPQENSQLSCLQRDILHLSRSKNLVEDASIQFHFSTTPHREVQNLYHTLLFLMKEKEIEPRDVLIMAPDITPYLAYIPSVFKELPYRITDSPLPFANMQIEGLLQLFSLDEKRWSAPAFLRLLQQPLFAKKQGWDEEKIKRIRRWVQKANINWGIDHLHRHELLSKKYQNIEVEEGNGTWMQGVDHFFFSLTASFSDKESFGFAEAELIAEVSYLQRELYEDLKPTRENTLWPLKKWSAYFKELNEKYFAFSIERETLFHYLDQLEKEITPCLFSTAFFLFQEAFSQDSFTLNGHVEQSIHFCSMHPTRAIPAKIIALLGMNESAFPRHDLCESLDLLKLQKERYYCPSRAEIDRFLFLETLISARDAFIISCFTQTDKQIELSTASIVQELLTFLDVKRIVVHPASSHDERYFNGTSSLLKNYSTVDFLAASTSSKSKQSKQEVLFPLGDEETFSEKWIDVQSLLKFFKRPLRHYFHETLRLYLHEDETIDEEEELIFSSIHFSKLRNQLLMDERVKAPSGIFQKTAFHHLHREIDSLLKDSGPLHSLELSPHEPFPPYRVRLSEKSTVFLIGKIDGIFNKGCVVFERGDLKGVFRQLPLYVLLQCLSPQEPLTIVCAKEAIKKTIHLQYPEKILKAIVECYLSHARTPSFLFASWIDLLLKGDEMKLEKKIHQEIDDEKTIFPELKWLYRRGELPSAAFIMEKERGNAEKLCEEIFHAWI